MIQKLIIIGSGPAGHSAAIYAGRANLEPLMFEWFLAGGIAAGGQLTTTTEVENYPGFDHIDGTELMMKMRAQSLKNGATIVTKTVDSVDLSSSPFKVVVGWETHLAHSLIIATGASAKRMRVPGEEKLRQRGISACAVCDGALPIYRDKHLVVIGGWDSACEEASFLSKFGKKISLLVRSDKMRASKVMQDRVLANPKIEVIRNTELIEVLGETHLEKLLVKNSVTQEQSEIEAQGLFYAIGHQPNTGFLAGQLELDEIGYIKTHSGTQTSVPGVFAAWDVQDRIYRQAITSAGTGCMAMLDAERRLSHQWLID